MSTKAAKAIRASIREWRMASPRKHQHLEDLARFVNPVVRGGMTITDGFIARNVF
jgi:RNA-directed DNA polymerase